MSFILLNNLQKEEFFFNAVNFIMIVYFVLMVRKVIYLVLLWRAKWRLRQARKKLEVAEKAMEEMAEYRRQEEAELDQLFDALIEESLAKKRSAEKHNT